MLLFWVLFPWLMISTIVLQGVIIWLLLKLLRPRAVAKSSPPLPLFEYADTCQGATR